MMADLSLNTYQAEYPASVLQIAGVDWAWRDTDPGSRRIPLVFLPGAGGTGDVFYRTINALRGARRTITLRYPALSDVESIISGLAGLLADIGLRKVDVAGSSLGGYIAQAIAINQPTLVRRALFGNSFFDASWLQAKVSRDTILSTAAADHLARTVAQLETLPQNSEEQTDFKSTMLALVTSEQSGEMARDLLAAVLGARPLGPVDLAANTIAIVDTEDDPVIDAETRSAMRDRYRESARYTFATGGHYPCLLNPTDYNKAIQRHFGGAG